MAQQSGIKWVTPPARLAEAVTKYGKGVLEKTEDAMEQQALALAEQARVNAPWTDDTGAARQGIFGTVDVDSTTGQIILYLSHGGSIDYGIWLELANGGKFSTIMPTIESKLPDVKSALDGVFD